MDGTAFVRELKERNERFLAKLDNEPASSAPVAALLKAALKNEIEAAEIAASWVPSTPEVEAKLVLARNAGEEARHYQLLAEAAAGMGIDLAGFHPLQSPSPVLEYLRGLKTTVERISAALVAREAMGARRNRQFLRVLEREGQGRLAQLYRDVINPDEEKHHQAGCALLAKLATTAEAQERARRAAEQLLEIGDRMRDAFLQKTGAGVMPGC